MPPSNSNPTLPQATSPNPTTSVPPTPPVIPPANQQVQINTDTIYINFVDKIDLERVKLIMNICSNAINQYHPKTLYFLFSSPGGDVDSGIALYNFLISLPVKIIMHNIGSIDSIANVVFVAGADRYSTKHSTFLFHGVNMEIKQSTSLNLNQLNELTDRIEKLHEKIAGIICQNSDLTKKEIEDLFLQGETKGNSFALSKKLIKAEKVITVPQNGLFVSINYRASSP